MMDSTPEPIGKGWIIAILGLLALLALGIALYLRMSAPIRTQPRRAAALYRRVSHNMCSSPALRTPDWV
jgi:hypothetical protein